MEGRYFFVVLVFLISILTISGILYAQRLIDLNKVWGDIRVLGINGDILCDGGDQSGYALASGDINGDGNDEKIAVVHWKPV